MGREEEEETTRQGISWYLLYRYEPTFRLQSKVRSKSKPPLPHSWRTVGLCIELICSSPLSMEPFLFSVHMTLPFLLKRALIAFGLQPDSLLAM